MISVKSGVGNPYDAPQHYGVFGILKLTKEHTKRTIINYSYFHPNGGIEMSSAPVERIYCIIKGSITAKGKDNGETHELMPELWSTLHPVKNTKLRSMTVSQPKCW